ncbi:YcaO-like family protein [Gordonia polyisoprenivorans]|uniref:YcaO-like family protein n=1 Tax=Gordonia polyisoprenivorans TaxID=84595 RepID=UPI001AD796B3|nr:YcaO-like family protein [Gordonia polyisoprenivorans]QTI70302.1 YcaO-like family protein [Gordonia polyisoprenivorans]
MTTPRPLISAAIAPATGVEIRPLDATSCVISRGESHHVIGLPAATAVILMTAWQAGRDDLMGEDLARAVRPLRALVDAHAHSSTLATDTVSVPEVPRRGISAVMTGDDDLVEAFVELAHPDDGLVPFAWTGARAAVNRAFTARTALVVGIRGARESDLIDIDRMCHDMRVRWIPVELTRSRLWVGPLVTPGCGASYEDTAARRLAAARDTRVHRVLRTPATTGDQGASPAELAPLISAALDIIADGAPASSDRVAGGGDVLHELWIADDGVAHRRHPVLPMPHRTTVHRDHTIDDLVDDRTGVIVRVRSVTHDRRVPATLATRQADVADIRAVSPWANNILCQGSALDDAESARLAALGESAERYCGNILDTLPVTWGSFDELTRRGIPVLDPRELVLYSDDQHRSPGFPFVPFTRDLRVHWVPGLRLADGSDVLVPASLVYVNWYSAGFAAAPPTNFCAFAGIAAGPDEDFAVAGALEEIIERHATMVWWLNAAPLPAVDGIEMPGLSPGMRQFVIHLDNEFGVPVAASVVHDDVDALVNVGFSARPRFADAARKALTEAFTLQEGSRDLLRSNGLHWKVMADGELNGRAFKPWRADRAYLDDFRADMHDCDDLMVQQQVYLDPRARHRMAHLLEPTTSIPVRTIAELPTRSAAGYRDALLANGIDPIVVDITTGDIGSAGMRVVRVIAPGTVGNAPAAFPFLGRSRVRDLAVQLGWRTTPLAEDQLNYFPMPHA